MSLTHLGQLTIGAAIGAGKIGWRPRVAIGLGFVANVTVLAVNWTGILAVIAIVVAVVAIVIAGFCVYGLVQVRRRTKAAQQATDGSEETGSR
jgi:hypothetical protein